MTLKSIISQNASVSGSGLPLTPARLRPILLQMARTLAQLRIGETAAVEAISGVDTMAIRLLEMGFVRGTRVKLVKIAPMGDPLQFQLRGYHVSLRRAEANRVQLDGSEAA